jgi:hypothetical protein
MVAYGARVPREMTEFRQPMEESLRRALFRWKLYALLLGVGFVVASAAATSLATKQHDEEPIVADRATRRPRRTTVDEEPKKQPPPDRNEAIRKVLEAQGWTVTTETRTKVTGVEQITFAANLGATYLMVTFVITKDEAMAKIYEKAYTSSSSLGWISRRVGAELCVVGLTGSGAGGASASASSSASAVLDAIMPPGAAR